MATESDSVVLASCSLRVTMFVQSARNNTKQPILPYGTEPRLLVFIQIRARFLAER